MSARPYFSLWRLLGGRTRAAAGLSFGRRTGVNVNSRGRVYARTRVGGFIIKRRIK